MDRRCHGLHGGVLHCVGGITATPDAGFHIVGCQSARLLAEGACWAKYPRHEVAHLAACRNSQVDA